MSGYGAPHYVPGEPPGNFNPRLPVQRPNLPPQNFPQTIPSNVIPPVPPGVANQSIYPNSPSPMIPQGHFPPSLVYRPPLKYVPNLSQFTPITPTQPPLPAPNQISTSIFVGSIPEGITDKWIESLLQTCGEVKSWNRLADAEGTPKGFGFCEYKELDGTLRAFRILTRGKDAGLELPSPTKFGHTKRLVIKVEENIKDLLDKYESSRTITESDKEKDRISRILVKNMVIDLIKQIQNKISPISKNENSMDLHSSESIPQKKDSSASPTSMPYSDAPNDSRLEQEILEEESKESRYRERKILEKEDIFKQKERRWIDHEFDMHKRVERSIVRELDRIERFSRDREDMEIRLRNWDDIKREKEQIDEYYRNRERWWARRKYIRDKELENDEKDSKLEIDELNIKVEPSKATQNHNKHSVNDISPKSVESKISNIPTFDNGTEVKIPHNDSEDTKGIITITSEKIKTQISDTASKDDTKPHVSDERKVLEELINRIPVDPKSLFNWNVKWEFVTEKMLNEKIKPTIIKRLKEYMGSINPNSSGDGDVSEFKEILDFILSHLNNRLSPESLVSELEIFLEEDAPVFVARLWRILVFETELSFLNSQNLP
ncbi:RNA-binding protein 25 [Smittium mucronatum]|uniref:RNA-binding protein 25 n=1 Tax=Smittium mucronatum TaxID=133383 RepID=A0A1R0H4N2_9FUNG|nr:RNA-binding protein 25 [Smittium mucronatum]